MTPSQQRRKGREDTEVELKTDLMKQQINTSVNTSYIITLSQQSCSRKAVLKSKREEWSGEKQNEKKPKKET